MPPILAALPGKMPLTNLFSPNPAFLEIFYIIFLLGAFISAQALPVV